MPEEWPGQADLQSRLKKLEGISSSKIAVVADIAVKSVKYYKFVVFAVEHHMKHGDAKARLQGMCIIDAILRSAAEQIPLDKNPYPSRFSKNLAFTLGLTAACSDTDRGKIVRIVKIWISAKLLPEKARQDINDWLQKNDSQTAGTVREPTSRLLSIIDKLKEAPPASAQPAPSPPEELDTFDYGDEDDDEARLASQARRLEEQSRKLEAEKEAAANAAKNGSRPGTVDPSSSTDEAPSSDAHESDLHRFGFVRYPDQSNLPAGMVRVLSCVLYIGGIAVTVDAAQLRSQIGSFGKIDDIRIVTGPAVNSAFVRYIDREEAESAKNLVRSYFPEYKIGWGKGVGVNKDDFDTRQGIGMVPEASLVRTPKPSIAARPVPAPESHHPHQIPVQTTVQVSVTSPSRSRHHAQQQPPQQPAAPWNGMAHPPSLPPTAYSMPPYGAPLAPAPPRSIGAVPASWDGGGGASYRDNMPPGVPPRSGWDATSAAPSSLPNSSNSLDSGWNSQSVPPSSGGAWGDVTSSSAAPPSSSWDGRNASASSFDIPQHGRLPAPSSSGPRSEPRDVPDRGRGSSWDSKPRVSGPPSTSSWDKGKDSSSWDQGSSSLRDQRGSSSTSWDKGSSGSWNKGSASRDPPDSRGGSGFDRRSQSASFGFDRHSQGDNNLSSGSSWGDTAPSGRDASAPNGNDQGRGNNNASSWGDNSSAWGAPRDDNQRRDSGSRSGGPPRGGGGRFNSRDRDRPQSDNPRPWNNRDGDRDNNDSDGRRGPPRNRDNNFRGGPRNDRDGGDRPPRNNDNGFRGGRGGGSRGRGGGFRGRDNRDSGSSWNNDSNLGGSRKNSQSDSGGWSGSANSNQPSGGEWGGSSNSNNQSSTTGSQPSASWSDQPSSGTTWDSAPSTGASWDTKPSESNAASSGGWQDSSSKDNEDSGNKRNRSDGGWGSLPADDDESNKRSRTDGW